MMMAATAVKRGIKAAIGVVAKDENRGKAKQPFVPADSWSVSSRFYS